MKKILVILILIICVLASHTVLAQCSICTRTAAQLGDQPAQGLNAGILYLAFTPFAVVGFIGYRWWKNNGSQEV